MFGLASCSKAEAPKHAVVDEDSLGGQIGVINYTDVPIGVVYVNGQWAGSMVPHNGGTSWTGSIAVPKKWDPAFKVTIKWSDDELYKKDRKALYVKQVPVEKYPPEDASFFYVAFFPNHEVKLYLTRWLPGWEGDPYQLEDPTDACLKRKPSAEKETCYAPEFREEYRSLQKQQKLQHR
ncbi:DUF3304 domain-containing protein [Cupriavidus neocaledonicus]|uniref:Hypothethical protein n=1 Tax=Cupriavidus neocaledonicus TaxID=1040979 RepID=A0A375H4M6_9BURK|nr:DUF3304 domain-containing protein [Cupriavidus neocaledonicus]SOZ34153.1 Hypothethical protein [Cupriavidus neocaledonicus]SPD45080.1 Hypothethical protein [Cupriavidus neocaledonicus]